MALIASYHTIRTTQVSGWIHEFGGLIVYPTR